MTDLLKHQHYTCRAFPSHFTGIWHDPHSDIRDLHCHFCFAHSVVITQGLPTQVWEIPEDLGGWKPRRAEFREEGDLSGV